VENCFEDQDVDEVTKNMADTKRAACRSSIATKSLVGIISLGDIAQSDEAPTDTALGKISRPAQRT
jgi:hypothetical protein